jgi:hypothetical protein
MKKLALITIMMTIATILIAQNVILIDFKYDNI